MINSAKLLFCLLSFLFNLNVGANVSQPPPELGNLIDWNPEDGCMALNGEWDFYWNELLSYEEIEKAENKMTMNVPASWSDYNLDSEGYATYRLKVRTSLDAGTKLGLYIKDVSSAYKVYINDMLVGSMGVVSQYPDKMFVRTYPQTIFFAIPDSEFDIIIQASSRKTIDSGLTSSLLLGSEEGVESLYRSSLLRFSILYGLLFVVAVFSVLMAILCQDIKYFSYLSLLCVAIFISVDLTAINLISRAIPNLDLSQARALLYTAVNLCLVLVTAYFYYQFKSGFYKTVFEITLLMSGGWQTFILSLPIRQFEAAISSNASINLFVAYALLIGFLNIAGIIKGARDVFIGGMEQLLCVSLLTLSALIDFSSFSGDTSFMSFPILHYSLMLILVVQMVIQAKQVRGLVQQQRNEELRFMQAQVKPHLLYGIIDTYVETAQKDVDEARTILEAFADYLRKTFDIKKSYRYYTLKEAIRLLQSYIKIELIRLHYSFEVNFELPDNLDVIIPTHILQPIVENAIVHGLSKKGEGGRLDVIIRRRGRYLYFTVKDNGVGMSPEDISNALDPSRSNSLANISKRLSLFNRKILSIVSIPDEGTEVSWRVRVKELKQ